MREKKPSERIIELMDIIRKERYPKEIFPGLEKDNKFMTHIRWMAVLDYLDEQADQPTKKREGIEGER